MQSRSLETIDRIWVRSSIYASDAFVSKDIL